MNRTVGFAIDGALVKGHDVLGEGPRFVTEDILDLAELFVQGGGTSLSGGVASWIVHLPVPVNIEAVPQPNDLHAAKRCGYGKRLTHFIDITQLEACSHSSFFKNQTAKCGFKLVISHTLPNIERDGHYSVQDDDIGPECEEGAQAGIISILSWQEGSEV